MGDRTCGTTLLLVVSLLVVSLGLWRLGDRTCGTTLLLVVCLLVLREGTLTVLPLAWVESADMCFPYFVTFSLTSSMRHPNLICSAVYSDPPHENLAVMQVDSRSGVYIFSRSRGDNRATELLLLRIRARRETFGLEGELTEMHQHCSRSISPQPQYLLNLSK